MATVGGGTLSKSSAGAAEIWRRPPRLDPDSIVKAVIYAQAAFRRFSVEEPGRLLGIQATVPSPPVAVSRWCSRRLVRVPSAADVEAEAMAVAALVCGREKGLTLGPLVAAYDRYCPRLSADHPVREMLEERFAEVAVLAEEDVMIRIRTARLPSEAKTLLAEASAYWGAPEKRLGSDEDLFPQVEALMQVLRHDTEVALTQTLTRCRTQAGLDAMHADVELEYQDWPTPLRGRLRAARANYTSYLQQMAQTAFGWPPTGNLAPICSFGRWVASELGADHPVVEDFVAAVRRNRTTVERDAAEELNVHLLSLRKIRAKMNTVPRPPKLLAEGYALEHADMVADAAQVVERRFEELGTESPSVMEVIREVLQPPAFAARMAEDAAQLMEILRRPRPPANPGLSTEDAEKRMAAAVRLGQLVQLAEVDDPHAAAAHVAEFGPELQSAARWTGLFGADAAAPAADHEEGWHRPPGFENVDQPLGEASPPPTPWKPPTPPPPEPEEPRPDVAVKMRLHGVTADEANQNSEVLILEKLAMIIAQECNVPREWITHVSLAPPAAPAAPPDETGEAGAGEHVPGAGGSSAAGSGAQPPGAGGATRARGSCHIEEALNLAGFEN